MPCFGLEARHLKTAQRLQLKGKPFARECPSPHFLDLHICVCACVFLRGNPRISEVPAFQKTQHEVCSLERSGVAMDAEVFILGGVDESNTFLNDVYSVCKPSTKLVDSMNHKLRQSTIYQWDPIRDTDHKLYQRAPSVLGVLRGLHV